jgi:Raf kinase inhibitor-like YbhB/YbcL family protein
MQNYLKFFSILSLIVSLPAFAGSLTLSSNDIAQGMFMDEKQEFNGFGCSGENLSPHLKWSNAPMGTKSFAITAYDPDAPTGSGWWHWQIINVPVNITELATNTGSATENLAPASSTQVQNDFGARGFGGACPPEGHGVHHYRFTVHALSVEKLELPEDASGALAGYMINANTIETSTIEALYKRD